MRATKKIEMLPLISILSLALVPCALASAALAGDSSDTANTLTKIHESDQREIDMGKMAEKNGKGRDTISFGKMLVKDHTDSAKKVVALAKKEKIELGSASPTMTDSEMSKMANSDDFDKRFAQAMLDDHTKDIAELTAAHDRTTDEHLKKLIAGLLPTLKRHQATAQKLVDEATK
jgi:putative membrane protein